MYEFINYFISVVHAMSSLSSLATEVCYRKIDARGKITLPQEFKKLMGAKSGSWVELQLHIIDNVPAMVCTLARGKK
jgi:hypothetical protein